MRAFSLKAYELRNQQWGPLETFNKALRNAVFGPGDRLPESGEEMSALLAKPLPPSVVGSEPARQYLAAAASAGLVKSQGPEMWKLGATANRQDIVRTVQLLTTGWLEAAVVDRILQNPSYREVMWNPTSVQGDAAGQGIFCIDTRGMILRYFECLPSLVQSPQDHLEAVAQRARRLGDNGAEATLVILKTAQGQDATLRHAARRLGVEVVVGAGEIVERFAKK